MMKCNDDLSVYSGAASQHRQKDNMNIVPLVAWHKPDVPPDVPMFGSKACWLVINDSGKNVVTVAQYVNKPLDINDPDPWYDITEEQINAIGWWSTGSAFPGEDVRYYPINFTDDYKLVAWGEFLTPSFSGFIHE